MSVEALPVPRALTGWLAGLWRHEAGETTVRVLPDGCHDMLFDLRDGTARVVGAMSSASVVHVAASARWLGVRFHPGVSALFFDAPARELSDQMIPLAELCKPALRGLGEQLAGAASHGERCARLATAFADARLRQRAHDHRLARAVARLRATRGALGVRELSLELGVGERQLERLFQERVGLSPKRFARVMRLERALVLLGTTAERHAELAARAGYSDQPHFVREVRELCGVTPGELALERRVGFVQAARDGAG